MEQSNLQQVIDRYLDRDNSDVDNWDGFMRSFTVCKVRRLKGGWQIIELHKMGDPTWLTLSEVFVTIKKRKFGCLVEFESYYHKYSEKSGLSPDDFLEVLLGEACKYDSLENGLSSIFFDEMANGMTFDRYLQYRSLPLPV